MSDSENIQILNCQFINSLICIELSHINKILPLAMTRAIPNSPNYLVGLMNVSGVSVPIIDLAVRLNLNRTESYTLDTLILLCSDGQKESGVIVDKIIELTTINKKNIKKNIEFNKIGNFFKGSVLIDNEISLLVNIQAVLDASYVGDHR